MAKLRLALLSMALFILLLWTPAQAAPGDALLTDEVVGNYIISGTVVGDTLYLLGDALYAYKPGDDTPRVLLAMDSGTEDAGVQMPSFLCTDGQALWAISGTGMLGQWDGTAFQWVTQLQWDDVDDGSGYNRLMNPVVANGSLYGLLSPLMDEGGSATLNGYELVCFNGTTGQRKTLFVPHVWQIAPYRDNKLLLLVLNVAAYNGEGGQILIYDPQTEKTEQPFATLSGFNDGGIAYDAAADTVYAVSASQVQAFRLGQAPQTVAYLPSGNAQNARFSGYLAGGYYVIDDRYHGTYLRNTDPQYLTGTPLRIRGFNVDADLVSAFMQAYPDIPVVVTEAVDASVEALVQRMITGDDSYDIIELSAGMPIGTMMAKGYLAAVTDVPEVAEAVANLYPQVKEALTVNGQIYGYPSYFWAASWLVDDQALAEFGFELPQTQLAFFQLLARWEDEFAPDYADVLLTQYAKDKRELAGSVIGAYFLHYYRPGQPLSFNTPVFRDVLEAIKALPYPEPDPDAVDPSVIVSMSAGLPPRVILNPYGDPLNRWGNYGADGKRLPGRVIPPPAFEPGQEAIIQGLLSVFSINANTPNLEQARTFLAFAAAHTDPTLRLMIDASFDEPQVWPGFQALCDGVQKEIDENTQRLESAEPKDRQTIQDKIAQLEEELKQLVEDGWEVTPQAVAAYQELAPQIRLIGDSPLTVVSTESSRELSQLPLRYLAGQISLDEAVRQMDHLIEMMVREAM